MRRRAPVSGLQGGQESASDRFTRVEARMTITREQNTSLKHVARIGVARLVVAVVLGCGAVSPLAAQAAGSRSPVILSGQVIDQKSGQAMQGAVVEVRPRGHQVVTDESGQFRVRLRPGDYLVTASLLGYGAQQQAVSLAPGSPEARVFRLEPQPEVLERVTVTVDRLESRRHMIPMSSRVWERDRLRTVGSMDQFLRGGAMITRVSCPRNSSAFIWGEQDCVYRRGQAIVPSVYIDDRRAIGGFTELAMYSAADVNRLEIYGHGLMIRMYTDQYVESVARGKRNLSPLVW